MMASSGYRRARREKAPKPLSVPAWSAAIGAILVVVGFIIASAFLAGLGMLLLCWGLTSLSFLLLGRRRRAARANG